MDSSDRNADDLFFAALEIEDAAARASFLEDSCGADAGLRGRVERLLAANAHVGRFLEPPTAAATVAWEGPSHWGGPEQAIGPYRLLEPIGEGGMGTVYMAEQTAPVRRMVALKVIKPGMDSRQVLARFEAERQALALMDHPNIAKVHDAGTTEQGRPYFVMELVKGVPITHFCDKRRLTLRERLELFIPVCQAVQHAHQKGVIHRDLKPSNVLVALYDGVPVPKVIDFGVAKATGQKLTEATLFTGFGAVVGTPEYMSPEQAELNQLDVDTRSDVYSLGVLLYELLTGTTPLAPGRLKEAAVLEILRVIREEEPPRPSTRLSTTEELPSIAADRGVEPRKLAGLVRGELDWVVMKALEKDRNRRYETASGLAADLRRYLDDEPVMACPPSVRYRLGKLARRNKGLLATSAVVLIALVAGTAVATWQAVRATRAERGTSLALAEARRAVDEMYTQVAEKWLAGQPALTQLQREFLEKALAFYERFAAGAGSYPQERYDALRALYRVGAIRMELGRHAEAVAALRQVVERGADLVHRFPDRSEFRLALAEGRLKLAAVLRETGKSSNGVKGNEFLLTSNGIMTGSRPGWTEEADGAVRQAGQDLAALRVSVPRDAAYRRRLAEAEDILSRELTLTRQLPEAESVAREALATWESLANEFPNEPEYRFGLATAYRRLGGHLMWWGGQNAKAEEAHRQAEARFSDLLKQHPRDRRFRQARADNLQNLAVLRSWEKSHAEAEGMARQAVALYEGLAADFPDVPAYAEGVAACLNNVAADLEGQGRFPDAEGFIRQSLALRERLADRYPDVPRYEMDFAGSCQGLAVSLSKQGKHEEARQVADRGLQRARAYWQARPELTTAPPNYTNLLVNRVRIAMVAGDRATAERDAEGWARLTVDRFAKDQLGAAVLGLCQGQTESREGEPPAIIQVNLLLAKVLIREADRRGLDHPQALYHLADLMTTGPDELRDPERALRFARRAVELKPGDGMCRQSLGWALYRAGDLRGCMEHLSERDFMTCAFLAMAHWRLGDKERARALYDVAERGLAGYEKRWKPGVYPTPTMLRRMRDEAAALLGMADTKAASDSSRPLE